MKKIYSLNNLGCAHCAAKMELGIGKIKNVDSATVSFMAQKLVIEADVTTEEFNLILDEAQNIISKIEPDCKIKR